MQTKKSKCAGTAVILSALAGLTAVASAGDIQVDAGFAVGPDNSSVNSYLGWSFSNPCGSHQRWMM